MDLEVVRGRRTLPLPKKPRIDSAGTTEKKYRLIDKMRSQIEEQTRAREILLAPCSGLQVGSKTIKAALILRNAAKDFAIENLPDREEVTIPAAILKNAQYAAYPACEFDESIGISGGIGQGLVDDHVLFCLQRACGSVVVRSV